MKKEIKLELNGQEYTFPLGLKFLGMCLNNLDLTITELADKMDGNAFMWSPIVMYESLKCGYGEDLNLTKDEFLDLLDNDENGILKIGNFNRAFVKTLNPDLPPQPKKKVTQKKKN